MALSLTSRPDRGPILPNKIEVSEQNAVEEGEDVIEETFDILDKGEKEIRLDDKHKDVIMILGNTGSGKTTFTQWVAGDNTKLISKETGEGTGEYIIEGPGISNSTIKSETIFPELVIDAKTNTAYYDCPGFSDTQGTSHEIAETYFIKKVLDFLENLKMVFTINHSSVRKGVDRQDFMKLLRHVTDLVKDIDKFKDSIAMVATKVDNQYRKQGNDIVLVGDDIVIAAIAGFLQEAKQYLEDNSKRPNVSEKENRFYENAIKFVEVLLEKEGEKYTRIGIFRRPDMPGPVSDIPLLREGKKYIEKIVYEKLNFSTKNNEDFGYTVSEKTKNDINEIVEEINKNLWSRLSNISEKILGYCENLVEQVRDKIRLFVNEVNVVDANPSEAKAFRYKFISAYNSTSELVNKMSNLTNPEELAVIVNTTTLNLNIEIPEDDILYIATQGNYFNFLQRVSDKLLSSKPWDQVFKKVETFLSASKTIILQDVDSAAKSINDRIQINLNYTVKVIHEEYTERIKSLEIQKLPDKLNRDFRIIFELTEEIKNEITTEKLVNATRYVSDNLKISLPEENLQNIANQGKYLTFLEIISDETLNVHPMMWLSPFENIAKYFSESEKWYTFLEDLYNKFSEYDIQKNRQKYNVADLEDWGKPHKPQGISVTPNTFKDFLNKIGNLNVAEYETTKNMTTTTDLQIEELNQALSLTLKHRPTVRCLETHIIVKGSFILLDETMQNLISNSDTNNSCNNFNDDFPDGKYNLLKMFALNNVFIDIDLSFAGKGISVAIIAPKWEVVGSRSIDLNGDDGAPHADPKAKNGAHPGNNGSNGAPGNPGVSGESFFGIGATFAGGANLKITANGGKGGLGQAGGDGAPGMPGKDAVKPSKNDSPCISGRFREFRCRETNKEFFHGICGIREVRRGFHIYGLRGESGGNGGHGGKGGKGGDPGNIAILELRQLSKITKLASKGKDGDVGKAGVGGLGGKYGNGIIANFTKFYFFHYCVPYLVLTDWKVIETTQDNNRGPVGSHGTDGANVKDIKDPVPAKGISRLPNIINEYKVYLRENINNRFQKCTLLQFLDLLNSNSDVRKLYDVVALINEFQGLEEQFPKLGYQMDFSPFYGSFRERIHAFAQGQKNIPNSNESRKVLNYLYTATLGRINNLRESSEQNLIIDMRAYLKMVEGNIKTLKDLQMINNKVDVVNTYKDNYKKGIAQKIEEAKSLIEKQISPEMENINAKIDDEVNTLIEETIALEKQAEKDWEKLAEKKKELENAVAMKGMFNCFKIIGGVVSFLGPVGEIAGTVIDAASTVGESLALNNQEKILNIPTDVESSLTTLKEKIEIMRDQKVAYLNKLLNNVSEEIKKNPEKLGDMTSKIEDIREKLQKVSDKELDFKHVSVLESELEENIKKKGVELKTHSSDKKSVDALKAIEKITQVVQFGSLFSKMHGEMKEDKEKMDTITKSMEEMKDKIVMLREYEKNIYDTTAPMLQEMEDHLKDISAKLGTKSHVALDVTKWQVQSSLKDMKLQMQQLTEGHDVKDDLSRSIEKLDEVMTTLINVYDRIQSYQDQQNLANYIADISSVPASNINIKDQQLVNAVNHLEFVIRANIVLEQYKSAIDALKQWVFPFADRYIERHMLPSQLELDNNIENLVENAARQIEAINQKIALYDASIMKGDQYLECEEFSSRYVSTQPFFVWKDEEYRSSISNLLSGKEVVLKADVKESAPHKDAIKFSEIDFDLKLKNETAQPLLYETLKAFDIRATHLGNSYYRYANKISLITSDSVTISYSYEKNDDGIPIRSNGVYSRLKSGDLLLSPYTLWKLRIIKRTSKYSFQDLEKYKNEINVELSGLGSYVDTSEIGFAEYKSFTMENNAILPLFKPKRAGLNECKRSKYRSARSVDGIAVDGDFMTNCASKGMSSPINFLGNFLKAYFVSNLVISINQAFFGGQTSVRSDCSELSDECTATRNIGTAVVSNPTIKDTDATSAESDCIKERIEQKSDIIFDVNFNGNNNCLKSFLLSDQKYRSNNHSTQVPDLNCSLLLADIVTRTITGNRYKSPIDECLLSPPEVMLGKISDGVVRNESDVKQMLQRHLSEKEVEIPSSWFSKLNGYAKSMLQFLGLVGNVDTEEYVQDVRCLFA
ncbi:hypothetical protein AVEN_6331-1 [Araneus ventricosus]|uniref:G domain-containing protein n=1 Tax=Araneus ventricosus TaxID=182803 RepID=A0A4Y2SB18_ARAVE|nr:hypothetical protein AVEN_6331-1 [Araneus ventricosus]